MALYLQSLSFTLAVVAPIFFLVLIGFLLYKLRLIDDGFIATAAKLVFTITLPALVFLSIAKMDFASQFDGELLVFFTIVTLLSTGVIGLLAKRYIHQPDELGVFIQGAFRGNYGIVGLAVAVNLYGPEGLAQAALLLAMVIPLYNLLAILALTLPFQNQQPSFAVVAKQVVKNPLIIAVVLALPFSYWQWQIPSLAAKTGQYFADLTLPLALLTIGATLNPRRFGRHAKLALWATVIKLLLLPIALTGLAWAWGFENQQLVMLFVLFGCPTAAASFVMAKAMQGNAELAANIILLTTLGSALTLSSGIFVMRLAGLL